MTLIQIFRRTDDDAADATFRRISLWVKIPFTAFCAVMIPTYLVHYGPTNFIYFCDEAILLTLVGLWLESPLLLSLPAVGILAPQLLWIIDFAATALGYPITGMTAYMFDTSRPLLLRTLSGFHAWLPILLVYGVWRLGYDRKALPIWTIMATATLLISFFLLPGPSEMALPTPVNINYVRGFSDLAAQTLMPSWAWLSSMIVGMPILLFAPTHLILLRLIRTNVSSE